MKILQVTPYYEPDFHLGGIVRSTSILCRELVALGHETTVWTTQSPTGSHDAPLHTPIDIGGVEVVYHRNLAGGFLFDLPMLRAARGVDRFDVVHVAAFWQLFGWPALHAARRRGVPTVISPRGSLVMVHDRSPEARKHRAMYRLHNHRALQRASAVHFTAELERQDALQLGLTTPMFRVANALAVEDFEVLPDRARQRAAMGLGEDQPLVVFLGRLDRRKALDVLVDAFARSGAATRGAVLALAGPDYGVEESLRAQVRALGLESQVRFLGLVDAKERAGLFAGGDLCALTSHAENFGNAAGEAMSAGLPVVVSETCGIAEHVEAYGAGRVVPVHADAIASALRDLLGRPDELPALGERARALVQERYAARAVARTMARAYGDVVTGTRSPECDWVG